MSAPDPFVPQLRADYGIEWDAAWTAADAHLAAHVVEVTLSPTHDPRFWIVNASGYDALVAELDERYGPGEYEIDPFPEALR